MIKDQVGFYIFPSGGKEFLGPSPNGVPGMESLFWLPLWFGLPFFVGTLCFSPAFKGKPEGTAHYYFLGGAAPDTYHILICLLILLVPFEVSLDGGDA